jgi:glycogen operon protein
MDAWRHVEGTPFPLGCSWVPNDAEYNFAVLSTTATAVRLRLFAAADLVNPSLQRNLDPLTNKSGNTWHCRVSAAEAAGASYYSLQVDSDPNVTGATTLFPLGTELLDPYARELFFPPGFRLGGPAGPAPGQSALAVLPPQGAAAANWVGAPWPLNGSDLLIYELHVGHFTNNPNSGVAPDRRGKYLGVVDKIPYLQDLGVTAVELMPVFCFDPSTAGWGYMPMSFFYPHPNYATAPNRAVAEFQQMVRALQAAGIEVILDVVFNHTAEGNQFGPTYSLKAIDNTGYYITQGQPPSIYPNYSGAGNAIDASTPISRRLILESLRYWVTEMHVDGFRFDLAGVLALNANGVVDLNNPPLFAEFAADPELADTRFIAEPWDGDGSVYLLGRSFPGLNWMQWNGQYRDTTRKFVKGDTGLVSTMMTRVYGSDDLFPGDAVNARHPWQSVNYIVSHDGFTLYDQVSYTNNDQSSWNCGFEGDAGVGADVVALRKRQAKNFLTILMMSNGTPMIRMGDEFLQTQNGNNNPYGLNDTTVWLDWSKQVANADCHRYMKELIAFRNSHSAICRSRYWRGDVSWYGPNGGTDMSPDSHTLAYVIHGAALGDTDIYVMINAYWQDIPFNLQEAGPWRRVIDTNRASPDDIVAAPVPLAGPAVVVGARSVFVAIRG